MELFTIFSVLMVMAAVFAYLNLRYLKLPSSIGVMILSLVVSLLLVLFGRFNIIPLDGMKFLVEKADLGHLLMKAMLSFLLFAGAIHINSVALKKRLVPVLTLATLGVVISTVLVGGLFWGLLTALGLHVPLMVCFVFGIIISPTDPIAVMGILKEYSIPKELEVNIGGESLLNDGVAVVLFTSLVEIAMSPDLAPSFMEITKSFLWEAVGGIVFGFGLGMLGYYSMRSIDDYKVEVLITLAMVMGGYSLAGYLHTSGPLAMVVAGLVTGHKSSGKVFSDRTRDYLAKFWELLDEFLNALLFLLIGLEMVVLKQGVVLIAAGCGAFIITIISRFISVSLPLALLQRWFTFQKGTRRIMTWGGLRGGISVALALSLPAEMPFREGIAVITYVVVIISIILQGLTIGRLTKRLTTSTE